MTANGKIEKEGDKEKTRIATLDEAMMEAGK